ncbi:MAG: hypothetical protein DHS20C15_23530 [Planctomycetota bacterium]|nr:MAG: hypothetical protein DHS20C15_23530 [Planctomycetota bacterium]
MFRLRALIVATVFVAPLSAQLDPLGFVTPGAYDLSNGALESVADLLPEFPRAHAAWLDPDVNAELVLTQDSFVELVFVREDADRKHAIGHFTHSAGGAVLDRQLDFPDLSLADKGKLNPGDAVTLRDAAGDVRLFPAGTRLGFFLAAHGAKHPFIKKWDPLTATLPYGDPAANGAVGDGVFSTLDAHNPEMAGGESDRARHAALIEVPGLLPGGKPTFVLGFEAVDRREAHADHDFNDVIAIVRLNAVDTDDILTLDDGDADGDKLDQSEDAFPTDAQRGSVLRVPGHGLRLMGLDEEYPDAGDGDMNDTVLGWAARLVLDATGDVKEIVFDAHLLARGSQNDHQLGLHFPGLPGGTNGSVSVERFAGSASAPLESAPAMTVAQLISNGRRLETLLPSSASALPVLPGLSGVNTSDGSVEAFAASSRLHIEFNSPVSLDALGAPPWDLYWLVDTPQGLADVHRPGFDAFGDRPAGLPTEAGASAFLDDEGWPWLMELPRQQRFAREGQPVEALYPKFFKWALDKGASAPDWPAKLRANKGSQHASAYLLARDFTLADDLP